MLKRFWKWLWPDEDDLEDRTDEHQWERWHIVRESNVMALGTQRRACQVCGLTQETQLYSVVTVGCQKAVA